MDLSKVASVCKELAIKAGQEILRVYDSDFDVEYKSDTSPLTQADLGANEIITGGLYDAFPDICVLSEESRDDKKRINERFCFIVDPLDGTKEFVNRNGEFTVNIALSDRGVPVVGVIYIPVQEMLYWAYKGGGAWLKETQERDKPIRVTDKIRELNFVGSKSHSGDEEKRLLKVHSDVIGSVVSVGSSIKGCLVADGKADVYYRYGLTCEWDTAAMHCIVEQAGGIFRQMDGSEMVYNRENTLNEKGFFAVNCEENIWI